MVGIQICTMTTAIYYLADIASREYNYISTPEGRLIFAAYYDYSVQNERQIHSVNEILACLEILKVEGEKLIDDSAIRYSKVECEGIGSSELMDTINARRKVCYDDLNTRIAKARALFHTMKFIYSRGGDITKEEDRKLVYNTILNLRGVLQVDSDAF